MAERIHIAGVAVSVGTLLRQRCAWCGEVLIDLDLANVAVAPGSDGPGTFGPYALVAVDGPGQWVVPYEEGRELPLRCCAKQRALKLVNSARDAELEEETLG